MVEKPSGFCVLEAEQARTGAFGRVIIIPFLLEGVAFLVYIYSGKHILAPFSHDGTTHFTLPGGSAAVFQFTECTAVCLASETR